jgi:hypothetical protein
MRDGEFCALKEGGEIIHPEEIYDEASHENCRRVHAREPNASNNWQLAPP